MTSRQETSEPFEIGGARVEPGTVGRVEIPVARLPTQTEVTIPVHVSHGARPGPRLWLSATIHGDELNGLEIIHRVLERVRVARLAGTLVSVPVVNVFGFIHRDRYLPDRRDLNRSFPGSKTGSLAARIAHLFLSEVVSRCTHGIDLHTGSQDRTNLPQVRADLADAETRRCARAFGAPIMIHGDSPAGSLRRVAAQRGIAIIVYEAGQPQRMDPGAIDLGVRGVLRVMAELKMYGARRIRGARETLETASRKWVRAKRSGILRLTTKAGAWVAEGAKIGTIRDVLGATKADVTASVSGLVIGHTLNPVVNRGDALVHIARDVVRRSK